MTNTFILDSLKSYNIILGSQSPRRKELLTSCGVQFDVIVKPINESFSSNLHPIEVVKYLCSEKAKAFKNLNNNKIIITADTIVVKENKIYNKAQNQEQASIMLNELSGGWHEVITGVSLRSQNHQKVFTEITEVKFKPLLQAEIDYYIHHFKPFDKAGAYGIQEWIGDIGIEEIKGSYNNVVGLPTAKLLSELKEFISDMEKTE